MSNPKCLPLADNTIMVDQPADKVFAFLSNHENYARWYPGVVSVVSANDLPHGAVGKEYDEVIRLPSGGEKTIAIRVVESQSPGRFVTEGRFPPLHPRMEISVKSLPAGGSSIMIRFFSRNRALLARMIFRVTLRPMVARQFGQAIPRLKECLSAI